MITRSSSRQQPEVPPSNSGAAVITGDPPAPVLPPGPAGPQALASLLTVGNPAGALAPGGLLAAGDSTTVQPLNAGTLNLPEVRLSDTTSDEELETGPTPIHVLAARTRLQLGSLVQNRNEDSTPNPKRPRLNITTGGNNRSDKTAAERNSLFDFVSLFLFNEPPPLFSFKFFFLPIL